MRFGVLGPLAVWAEDGAAVPIPEAKVRALLTDLLAAEGRAVPVDRLIDDLWGERLPRNPVATLQTRVSQLRRALDAAEPGARDLVMWQPTGYRLAVGRDAVDAGRFRALVARTRDVEDPRARAALLAEALDLWRGPAYADFTDSAFTRSVATVLDEERVTALGDHAEARLDLGEHHTLAGELGELVARHPFCERLRAVQLRALYQSGRQSEALAAYAEHRTRLADELGIDPSPEVTALYQAILEQAPALRAASPTRPVTNLPAAAHPLIGRSADLLEIRDSMTTTRLLTLTGPGGVGKSALALRAIHDLGCGGVDEVWSVELSDLEGPDIDESTVAAHIARALALPDADGAALRHLTSALADRNMAIVLENCERAIEPVAVVVDALVRAAHRMRILATSQEPLAVAGERVWVVAPLPIPPANTPAEEVNSYASVELFADRARAAAPGFRLDSHNAAAVAEICRRLDGLPLALELAAATVRTLGVAESAARLDDRFTLLGATRRGGPARHRGLRAAIDWSWQLLTPREQLVLRRTAVHVDGATIAAVAAVTADGESDVLPALARLVERSLVQMTESAAGPRYSLLESVRAYAAERLGEAGELTDVQQRHMRYYTDLSLRARRHGTARRHRLSVLEPELGNLRAALDSAVSLRVDDAAAALVDALTEFGPGSATVPGHAPRECRIDLGGAQAGARLLPRYAAAPRNRGGAAG